MSSTELLNGISDHWKQHIYEALFQAMGEDYQASRASMDLQTDNGGPFTKWDLAFRNLISFFKKSDISYVIPPKSGSWSYVLAYDEVNNLVLSFMKKDRYTTIVKSHRRKIPRYISELLSLNKKLKSRQQSLFGDMDSNDNIEISDKLRTSLNDLCVGFKEKKDNIHHALVVFDYRRDNIQFLKLYLLDKRMNIIEENNWLEAVRPIISNEIPESMDDSAAGNSNVMLNKKSFDRIKDKSKSGDQGTANQNTSAGSKEKDNFSKKENTTS